MRHRNEPSDSSATSTRSAAEIEDLRRRMAECVVLLPTDPLRREVVKDVIAAGSWAEDEWVGLVASDERLRLDLLRAEPPVTLGRRLRALIETGESTARHPIARRIGWRRATMAIAAALLIVVSAWLVLGPITPSAVAARFDRFSAAAVEHQSMRRPMIVQASNPADLQQRLMGTVMFPYHIPDLTQQGYTLVGARPCHLDGQDIIQSHWRKDGRIYSLYVFCPPNFNLPETFDRRTVRVAGANPASPGHEVQLWTAGGCGYALMLDDASESA